MDECSDVFVDSLDVPISIEEVEQIVQNVRVGKSAGIDGVLNEMIKCMCENKEYVSVMARLYQKLQQKKNFPSAWSTGLIVNLFKGKSSPQNVGNWRGLTILPNLSKIYTKMLSSRVQQWAADEGIINDFQDGCR